MAMETNLEEEFKFDVDPEFDPPDLRSLVGRTERLPEQHLITTYRDTPDRRLWAAGITLRHRLLSEGDAPPADPGKWTLKLPVPDDSSDDRATRSELSWKGNSDVIPPEVASIVAGVVRRSPLEPVVVLSTDRRRLLLHDRDTPWAEVDDDTATVTRGGREGLRFRQLEIELLENGEGKDRAGELEAVLSEFRRAGAAPGGGSKLALAAGLAEQPKGSVRARAASDVRSFVTGILSADLDLLVECDYRLRVSGVGGDPAGFGAATVHESATAVEGLLADLRVLGAVLDPVWVKHVRTDLKWLGGLLERLEDEDVLVARVRSHVDGAVVGSVDPDTVEELVRLLRSDRHLGATELREALTSDRYTELLDRLHAGVDQPPLFKHTGGVGPDSGLEVALRSILSAHWRVVTAEVEQVDSQPAPPSDDALDHLGVLANRLAHAAELAEPYLGKRAGKTASASGRLVSLLRRLRRSDHAARALAEIASHPAVTAPVAFVAGLVAGRAEGDAERYRSDWRKAAEKVHKVGRSAWSR